MSGGHCGCGKRTFTSRGKAEASVAAIKRFGEKREKTPDHAYPCPQGNGWHLTSHVGGDGRDRFGARKGRAARGRRR